MTFRFHVPGLDEQPGQVDLTLHVSDFSRVLYSAFVERITSAVRAAGDVDVDVTYQSNRRLPL